MVDVLDLQFKNSIRYGMTYEQFWFDCPSLYYIYEEVYLDKIKEIDINNWQLGQYIKVAIDSCFSDKCKYPNKPIFSSFESEKVLNEQEKENERLKARIFFSNLGDYVAIK